MSRPQARPVCILGIGRSGTSLAARAINLLGVDLGPEEAMLEPSDLNPGGFWEQREVIELNEEMLIALGGNWWRPPPRVDGWERSPEMEGFRVRIEDLIGRYYGGRGRWGFKDPRTTLTLPIWRQVAGDFDYVICLRNPLEVIGSAGDGLPEGTDGYALWLHYTCEALRLTGGGRRAFVFYEEWFTDPTAVSRRLARFLHGDGDAVRDAWKPVAGAFEPRLRRQHTDDLELATCDEISLEARALHFLVRSLAAAETQDDPRSGALQAVCSALDGA